MVKEWRYAPLFLFYTSWYKIKPKESTEMKTQRLDARTNGLTPVCFNSEIDMVEPTKNSVNNNKCFDVITKVFVSVSGNKW